MLTTFSDRSEAGRLLAEKLMRYAGRPDVIVLGLPRGGMPVASEVARALDVPLDVFIVRKLGVPGHEELAMGAVASGGIRVVNNEVVHALQIPEETIKAVATREAGEVQRREAMYRGDRAPLDIRERIVIVVDDGIATGSTMRAAVVGLRKLGPKRIIVAVPTAAPAAFDEFQRVADECVCVITPAPFYSVGLWYDDFAQTTDDEVRDRLEQPSKPVADIHRPLRLLA